MPVSQETFQDHARDGEATQYRALSVSAIFSVLLGALSAFAFWHPILWIVPVAAAVLSLFAIRRIDSRPGELFGRGLAVLALSVSLVCLSAAASRHGLLVYRAQADARELGLLWFEALRDGRPELAAQLTLTPGNREPEGTDLVAFYQSEPGQSERLRIFLSDSIVRAVLKLGKSARIRYLGTEQHRDSGRKEVVFAAYAVTYEEDEALKSFFVRVVLERSITSPRQASAWWVHQDSLYTSAPEALKGP